MMLTEQAYEFSNDSMSKVAATLYWREITAGVDCELGRISREEYHKISRLHARAERELKRRRARPYVRKNHKGGCVIGGAEWQLQMHNFNVNSIWLLSNKLSKKCCEAIADKVAETELNRLMKLSNKARQLYADRLQKAMSQMEAAAC